MRLSPLIRPNCEWCFSLSSVFSLFFRETDSHSILPRPNERPVFPPEQRHDRFIFLLISRTADRVAGANDSRRIKVIMYSRYVRRGRTRNRINYGEERERERARKTSIFITRRFARAAVSRKTKKSGTGNLSRHLNIETRRAVELPAVRDGRKRG